MKGKKSKGTKLKLSKKNRNVIKLKKHIYIKARDEEKINPR
jgi:hypothetical protein|tara:strand:+ start:100 stop:222 length:123 start_codon:yes stop_codon:yes gene_type:complete